VIGVVRNELARGAGIHPDASVSAALMSSRVCVDATRKAEPALVRECLRGIWTARRDFGWSLSSEAEETIERHSLGQPSRDCGMGAIAAVVVQKLVGLNVG
jgi:hypothetical protein